MMIPYLSCKRNGCNNNMPVSLKIAMLTQDFTRREKSLSYFALKDMDIQQLVNILEIICKDMIYLVHRIDIIMLLLLSWDFPIENYSILSSSTLTPTSRPSLERNWRWSRPLLSIVAIGWVKDRHKIFIGLSNWPIKSTLRILKDKLLWSCINLSWISLKWEMWPTSITEEDKNTLAGQRKCNKTL